MAGESPSVFVFLWGVRTSKVPVVLSYELILTDQIILLITDIYFDKLGIKCDYVLPCTHGTLPVV